MRYDKKSDEVVVNATDIRRFSAVWPNGVLLGLKEVRFGWDKRGTLTEILGESSEHWEDSVYEALHAMGEDAGLATTADAHLRREMRLDYRAEGNGFPWWWRWAT